MQTSSRAPNRELLLANHAFPGPYLIKAFGPNDARFRGGIQAAVERHLGPERVRFSERKTKSGTRICITAELNARSVDEVIAVYDSLYDVAGLALVL
jgi:putative lipoic acid-binding regulatory protein